MCFSDGALSQPVALGRAGKVSMAENDCQHESYKIAFIGAVDMPESDTGQVEFITCDLCGRHGFRLCVWLEKAGVCLKGNLWAHQMEKELLNGES